MVGLAADAARSHDFDEKSLQLSLAEIARNSSYADGSTVNEALEEGWKRGIDHAWPTRSSYRPKSRDRESSGPHSPT